MGSKELNAVKPHPDVLQCAVCVSLRLRANNCTNDTLFLAHVSLRTSANSYQWHIVLGSEEQSMFRQWFKGTIGQIPEPPCLSWSISMGSLIEQGA